MILLRSRWAVIASPRSALPRPPPSAALRRNARPGQPEESAPLCSARGIPRGWIHRSSASATPWGGTSHRSRDSVNRNRGVILMKSKYYVRMMRPTFHRAILTVEAQSAEAAVRQALGKAERLSEADWAQLEIEEEPPVIEIVLSDEEAEADSEADALEYVRGERRA